MLCSASICSADVHFSTEKMLKTSQHYTQQISASSNSFYDDAKTKTNGFTLFAYNVKV